MASKSWFRYATYLFVLIEVVLCVLIQLGGRTNGYCYASIVLAFLFAVLSYSPSSRWALVSLGLLFTVVADYFLVARSTQDHLLGVINFLIVQCLYVVYLHLRMSSRRARVWHIVVRVTLTIIGVALPIAVLGDSADALSILSVAYYLNLLTNVVYALVNRDYLFGIGLVLFACCDICVGLGMLPTYIPSFGASPIYGVLQGPLNLAWLFYLPSQTIIALSISLGARSGSRNSGI